MEEYDFRYECRRLVEQMAPRGFKTFRTEFNITSSTEHSTSTSSTTNYSQTQYVQHTKSSRQENGKHSHTTVTVSKDDAPVTKRSKFDSDTTDTVSNGRQDKIYTSTTHITQNEPTTWGSSMQFSEIRSLKRIHKVNEGIGTDIIETPGIIHPVTGEVLTIGDAISLRILDARTGRVVVSPDGMSVTIEEAVQRRVMDPVLAEKLAGPCGITEDGRDVSLLEAIQRELYDAEHGFTDSSESRVKVINTSGTSIAEAIDKGKIDTVQGTYTLDNGEIITVKDAYQKGYLTYTEVKIKTNAITLYDALAQGLVDERSGWILDRNSGNKFQIDAALKHGLINGDVREIVDPRTDNKITLYQALDKNIINPKLGKYINVHEKLSFMEAKRRQLIIKPMTLKDVCDKNLYDEETAKISSPLNSSKISILESISRGVLDCDTIKSVTNTKTNELLSLSESMAQGIILPEGTFKDALTGEVCTIPVAVDRGLITSVAQKSIFDIDGFKNPETGEFVSYNAASAMGLISKKSRGSLVTDFKTGKLVSLKEGSETGIVQPQVFNMLDRKIGIFENNVELTVLEAVFKGYIDPKTGNLIDPHSKKVIPVNDAVKSNFITPDGAALLNSLLAINITSQTISKIVKRYCTVTTSGVTRKEMKMTFGEAVRQGLIDEFSQTFRDPETNQYIPIQQALNEGLLGTSSSDESETSSPTHKTGAIPKVIKRVETVSPSKSVRIIKRESMEIDPNLTVKSEPMQTDQHAVIIPIRHDSKTATNNFLNSERHSTMEKQVFELPPDGWFLSEAIEQRLFDPVTGLFIIPGTDRLVSFEECVKLQIINPSSAVVVDPTNSRKISLIRSIEKRVLNSTGHYKLDNKPITMKEAIEKLLVILQSRMETHQVNQRLIQITKISGKPDIVEVSNILDKSPPVFTEVKSTDNESSGLEPLQVNPGVIYDPSTALVIFTESGKSENLLDAVKQKKIQPELVQVKDPYSGKDMTLNDAIRKGVINKDTGEYKDNSGRKLSLNDAAKFGVLSVIGAPLVAAAGLVQIVRNAMVIDPNNGEEIPMEVAYERGLVDEDTYKKYEAQAIVSEVPSPDHVIKSKTEIVSTTIIIKDPKTGKEITPEEAVQQGLITPDQLKKAETKVKVNVMDSTMNLDEVNRPSAGEITRGRVTTEPKYKVSIGRARSLSQSPEREAKPVVLQKMRKKVIKPKDAVQKGMIDKATADILDNRETFTTNDGETLNLSEAISNNKLDGNKGAIVDPQRGDILTINEAISRGILDPNGTNQLLVPLNRSLSVPQLVEQGLIEPQNCKIVHPETGAQLTLHEAIVCDIVDPLCKVVEPTGNKITLEQAIAKGDVDDDKSVVKTKHGKIDLLTAVEKKVFDDTEDKKSASENIPPTGMTFPVAMLRGLVDSDKKEIVHPITGVRKPIETAIKENFIMAVPYPVSPDCVDLDKALSMNLIDSEKGIFTNPKTGEVIPIKEAVESGLLLIKPMENLVTFDPSECVTSVTETITSYHTITTKTIELLSGYALVSTKEVKNMQTGEIIPIEIAKEQGIVKDEKESKENFTTREIKMSFSDALKKGLVDMNAGTYTNPETGKKMSISNALKEGYIDDISTKTEETMEIEEQTHEVKTTEMTLVEAYENIYDEKTKKFVDPESPEKLLTFTEALDKNIIDPNAIIYDTEQNQPITVKQAVEKGLIDSKSGEIQNQKSGNKVNVKEAAKMGLLAIVGAPVLAGMAVAGAVKSIATKTQQKIKDNVSPTNNTPEPSITSPSEAFIVQEQKQSLTTQEQKQSVITQKPVTRVPTIEIEDTDGEIIEEMSVEEIEYERMPIGDAIQQRKIEPKICRIFFNEQELPLTVQDALMHNEISPLDVVDIINRSQVSLVQESPKYTIIISRQLKPEELAELGVYNPKTKQFIDPKTGNIISFQDLLFSLDFFNIDNIFVKDLNSNPAIFVPIAEAFEKPLIDRNTGYMVDPKTGKRVSFFEAIKLGWIIERKDKPRQSIALSIENAVNSDILNPSTGNVIDRVNNEPISLFEAINNNVIDPDSIAIRNPKNNEIIPYSEAVEQGIVDVTRGVIVNIDTRTEIEFSVAFLEGFVLTSFRKPVSLEAVINKGLYKPETGKVSDLLTKQQINLHQSIDRGIIDPVITECKDTLADKKFNLTESLESKLIDGDTGKIKDTQTGSSITLDVALHKGLITTQNIKFTLIEAIIKEYYFAETGKILNPATGDEVTLHNAIKSGYVDINTIKLKDDKSRNVVPFKVAVDSGLIDTEKGVMLNPVMTLDDAFAKGYILSTIKPWSLQEALAQNCYDTKTGLLIMDDQKLTILEAIQKCFINPDCLTVKHPVTGEMISLSEAIKEGIIDPKNGKVNDPVHGTEMNLYDALERGLIIPSKRKFSLPEAVFKGFYDPESGKFSNPQSKEKLPTDRAIKKGFIDPQSTLVNINNTITTFEKAVDDGIIDTKHGIIRDRDTHLDFQEAFERGIFIEARKPMSLSEALVKGLYDSETSLFLDPQSGEYMTLKEALKNNVIDSDSVYVKDTKSDSWKKLSLLDAIKMGYVNCETATVMDFSKPKNVEISIIEAFDTGLVVDSKAPVSIQRAIHQGLYDEQTGKITDSESNTKITLHEAIRRFMINPQLPCYWDVKSERLLNLSETCRLGIIDRRNGSFKDPIENKPISLSKAMEQGLIVDIETAGFSLYEVIGMGLYDPITSSFTHPSNCKQLSLAQSCKDELINPLNSIVKNIKTGKYVKLNEAIEQNLIDDNLALYNLPNGKTANLIDARDRGLIVSTTRPLSLEDAIKNCLYRPDTGKFVEPLTGEYSDLSQAININLVDPNITVLKDPVNGQLKDLLTAINIGDIDVNKGRVLDTKLKRVYNLDKALEKGLLVTLDKPLIPKSDQVDVTRSSLKDSKSIRECTIEEAIKFELLDPEIAVVKDVQSGKFKTLGLAVVDGTIDVNKRATFEPQTAKVNTLIITLEHGTIIFLREPLSFEQAVELGNLDVNTGKFTDPQSKELLSLKDAVTLGLIDPDSALIKDGSKKKIIKLPEAFRRGLMDAEKGNVLDTTTSKLYTLSTAVDNGLLFTPSRGLSLIETFTYGLYNPTTGGITNPFDTASIIDRKRLTLTDAIDVGLLDPTTTVVKDPEIGSILPLSTALDTGLIDNTSGKLQDKPAGKSIDLIKAHERGLIVPAEARQAVEEKYKLCDETLTKLLQWISEIEEKISSQDVVREVEEDLRNQINTMKQIKDDLEQHSGQVSHCSDQVRQLVLTAGDVLSKGEVLALEKSGRSLKSRYDKSCDRSEKLLRRLLSARDDLVKFKNELTVFSSWLDKARRTLEDKERSLSNLNRLGSSVESTREFVSDVIAHQADLRFITMAAQKFVDESKEYLSVLNEFRTTLPQRLPHIEPLSSQESPVRNEVSLVTAQYRDLLSRANSLSDRLSGVGGKQREYTDALDKARNWLRDVEPRSLKIISDPIGAEPRIVEEQLNRAKALNNEFVAQGRLIDTTKQALDSLLRSLDGQLSPSEMSALETPVMELSDKYKQLSDALAEKCQDLDSALVQSQGVQDALDGLVGWLNTTENQFKSLQRPASLIKERLEEQLREHRVFQSDIDMHRASVDSVTLSASELVSCSSNMRIAKKIESKLHDVKSRFDKLLDKTIKRGEFLEEINGNLSSFNTQSTHFEKWIIEIIEVVESREITKLSIEDYSARMDDIAARRNSKKKLFDDTVRGGKDLVGKRDVTDTAPVRDTIKLMESQWKDLNTLLEEKQKLSKQRSEQLNAYESLRDQVLDWLTKTENKISRLDTVAVETETLKHQNDELKPIVKEYREYGVTIDKVNDLGNMYDSMLRSDRPDSPARRRSQAYSPTKRPSVTASSPLRRLSQDARSPSPTKGGLQIQSPVSPGGSSGFSSRRSSQDGFHLEELSPVQQQLSEINNRYSLLGIRINDRQNEIDSIREELRKHLDNLRTLSSFLDKVQRQLPKETIPNTKEEADKVNKQIRVILEEMYEKQSLLDSTKSQIKDLVRRKPGATGADNLNDELEDVASRWRSLNDRCKDRIKFMEDMKDFHDTHDSLNNWLGAKDRMMTVLGPISSDSRMVQSQVQQVQVLREEFRTQQPQLQHLIEIGDNVLARLDPNSSDGQKVNNKLTNIQKKWADLLGKLEERADSLGAAADTSREFDAGLNRLKDALQGISDALDDLVLDKDPEEQLRKVEHLDRQLEGQRPLLADAEAAGAQLCEVLSDPASRAEIQGKLAAVGRQYNNLQKKLDLRKAEIEGSLRDGRQFEASCAKTLGWLSDELGALSERLLISADRDILQQQFDNHEPIYRDVMAREHEVIMLLNKGKDIISRNNKSENRSLQRDIDKIQSHWDKLRKEIVDRHTKLQTCMEHCRKYYRAQETFLPWLRQAEDKLDALKPASFKRKHMEKQIKELQNFRSDVWKHSGEYENNRMLGDTFLSACDIDKEVVKSELSNMKQRWDKLNNDLLDRTQALEDMARRLGDYSENLRDLEHNLQRCEDRLASHDALGGAAKDPKLLDRIKTLREETAALKKPLQIVRQSAVELVNEAGNQGVDATHLTDEVDNIGDRIDDLQAKLDDRCSELQSAATAVTQFNDQVKGLSHDLSDLEAELDNMKAPGRDFKTIRAQMDEIAKLIHRINKSADDVNQAVASGEYLVDSGFAPDTAQTREQVEMLRRQLGRLDERARNREQDLETAHKKLEAFYLVHSSVVDDIQGASEQLRKLKPIGSEVDSIRAQQEDFRRFRSKTVEPLSQNVDECNRLGQSLIQSASSGVNTTTLEKDLEKMNEKWNDLKERMNDRERRLDVGLLQSGKFQEALDGLAKWLTDTEEMVANQKPPSADYKVVKAQLQEQKFLKKMLLDRQNSMSSLFTMGNEIAAEADPTERKAIERQLKELMGRFDRLTEGAQQRTLDLEQAMHVAKQFQDKLIPLQDWLEKTEKKVKDMELIPTDEEKIQQRIREHDALHGDILEKKPDFGELTDIASNLMSLVGEDEAAALADKLQDVTDRYGYLVDASDNLGILLTNSRQGLRHLVLTYQDLVVWMEGMEQRLGRYKVLAVHTDKLLEQMDDLANLTEEIAARQNEVDSTVDAGLELMKHISSDEALQLKDKLDSLQRRYNDLTSRGADLLKHAQDILPLVQQFHINHNKLVDWMLGAESVLKSAEPHEGDIARLEIDIQEMRPVLESINLQGPQLCQASPGEGAATIEGLVTRDNRRFDAIVEQIQRKAERIHLGKQRALEVTTDIDELLEWFREVDGQIRDAEPPSAEPDVIRVQLKEHKALNDDISSQKGRVRDVLSTAKKVLRESPPSEDTTVIREKMEDLRETMDTVSSLSSDRLGILEQALPLAEHFHDTHAGLSAWLDDMEQQVSMLAMPALRPDLIAQQQDRNEMFVQSINEHKPLVDKLNKTGEALIRLCNDDDGAKVQEMLDADNTRYNGLRAELRERQQALEQALQESSQFTDKLEGMLRALANTADQVNNQEAVSAHPPKIRDQIDDNCALVGDLDKRKEAYAAVKRAADDVINKAGNRADPAIKDIKRKLEKLNNLWSDIQKATTDREHSLEDTLEVAQRFWNELHAIMATLRDLEDNLTSQEPPAVEPKAIQKQQVALQEIRQEIDQTKPEVEQVRASGQELMQLCGEPDKPEVKKHMEDLDHAWDNITALYAKREENLIDAMEKAMEFHETLQNLLEFLAGAEDKFERMGPLGSDIEAVKKQIEQLKRFKAEVDPHMVKVEALNRQAQELTERTSVDQAAAIKEPLSAVNIRWDALLHAMVERQRQLENALLRLGQFQHALNELLVWIDKTENTLDELKPVAGDSQILEVELAKLKVLVNDIQAHQTSVDTLNDAGRQIIESGKGTDEASVTQEKLSTLNKHWRDLLQKAADRQRELEDALRDAQRFHAEIQDLLSWLGDIDGVIASSKPVGGLPETASEQLERFMEVYNELEETRPKVETVLQQGQEYLKKGSNAASNLQHNLRTLKQRWDSVTARANDKKIKLEIALKEATEFHDALQAFVDWLTNAEKVLSNLKPVSRVMETILQQIEDHKAFQKDVSVHRETMLNLDKKGTHLKYFSQKQDVILIKNLLISVQHRWERVVSKSAERTRALDHGYKEAKEFHDSWSNLMNWLTDTEKSLDDLATEAGIGNDPEKIKARLAKHQEFQRALSAKQVTYDNTMKAGKHLKERAPKIDEVPIKQMLIDLKNKWTTVCSKSVDRQRKLEEALLFSGQFKDAVQALLEWLKKVEKNLAEGGPVHGDLDTVNMLMDQHKSFERDLEARSAQMESVTRTGHELEAKASKTDAVTIRSQINELNELWDQVSTLSNIKTIKLEEALKDAEQLHKAVHMLLEWLSDAEMKLRFAGSMPDDEQDSRVQLAEHQQFLRELKDKELEKDDTLNLAHKILAKAHPDGATVVKHWITIIQTRWEEVSSWALQREQRLTAHMQSLRDLDDTLEELLAWLQGLENTLLALKEERLPDDIPTLESLIADHKEFMENTMKRQTEVDRVCKARQIKTQQAVTKDTRKLSARNKTPLRGSQHDVRESSPDNYGSLRRQSRTSPGREVTPDPYPHIGPRFPPKGSKGSEPEFRTPRVKLLWDRWRNVWVLAWERQRALYDKLAYLQEVDKVRNFSWDNWRKRFLKFMNHKKSRLTDLFRKMDKDNNGLIPREDFINGIMNTKFDTSRLEMNAVADLFDRNNSALIDWKEFIAALRPDWEETKPGTEADKIHDEVKRLVMLCTCRQKFRVFQVGEGKYRFGDSQKLRLVRILRSTVMVRVGGGWVALDEFLLKNDPCRVMLVLPLPDPNKPEQHDPWCPFAKGRTNIELREQFILADGVSQSMTAFKPRTSASQSPASTGARTPTAGPITKVRERSVRSVPMGGQSRASRTSLTASTPDSLSDNESGTVSRTFRKPSTFRSTLTPGGSRPGSKPNSRPSSRPASRAGSKPPSRHGSNLSLDSTDDGTPSRIPIHKRMTPTSNRLTTTGTTGSARKVTVANGSSTSRPRTPTGLTTPTSTRSSGIPRASSIPTLTGTATPPRSRIPVYVGTPDNDPESPSTSSGSYSVSFSTGSTSTRTSTKSKASSVSRSQSSKTRSISTTNAPVLRTASRTRTPSGSNTPVPPGMTTAASKLTRKPSSASDTPTGVRKGTKTPTESKAPFRL